jgi:hypothetical protein
MGPAVRAAVWCAGGVDYRAELQRIPRDEWHGYLTAYSGLPGPRGNLELADVVTSVATREQILELASLDDEYLRFCGTQALGRLLVEDPADDSIRGMLHSRASEPLWRVREAVARALQVVGDAAPSILATIAAEWINDPDPYVRRAALAAVCEPRLLASAEQKADALRLCDLATDSIRVAPLTGRRDVALRNLRQALGYCWSVAIAADPERGVPLFEQLRATDDPDVKWIVASNLTKARLRRVLA